MVAGFAVLTAAAEENTTINEEDARQLDEHHGGGNRMESWRGGMAIQLEGKHWVTTSWPELETKELSIPAGYELMDLFHTPKDHFVFARKQGQNAVLRLENEQWVPVELPKEVVSLAGLKVIPSDVGFALNSGDLVWWQKNHAWRQTRIGPCPAVFPKEPAGDVQFVQNEQLYAGCNGGEWGSTFCGYQLVNQQGPWSFIWQRGPPVQRMFVDAKGALWAYAQLAHLSLFSYTLLRRDPKEWKTIIEASPANLAKVEPGERHRLLQSDVKVIDVAPMPDGRLALLTEDFGIYTKDAKRSDGHPLLIDLPSLKLPGWRPVTSLRIDDGGNVYVITAGRGVLAFHKSEEGPWRVKQVKIAERR